jgi:hypothetical protein
MTNICALACNTQYSAGYKGLIIAHAAKNSEQGAAAPATKGYIPSVQEQAAVQAEAAREHARYLEHGIISNPEEPTAPHVPGTQKYIPSFPDEAAATAQA